MPQSSQTDNKMLDRGLQSVCSTGQGPWFGQLRASGLNVRSALKVISEA